MKTAHENSKPSISKRIAYRIYLGSMRIEGMWALQLRRWIIDFVLARKHRNLNVFAHVYITHMEALSLGTDVSINRWTELAAEGGISIGNYVAIGHGTSIISANHGWADEAVPIKYQPISTAPVTIGDNVWIGARVCILAGVSLASGTIVGAGSVVTRSVKTPNTIIGGVPAKQIGMRFERQEAPGI